MRPGGTFKALTYAVLVHLVVIGILVISFHWASDSDAPSTKIVKAVAVKDTQAQKAKEAERRKQEQEIKKARRELERKKQAEAKKRRLAEQVKRKKEEEKKRKVAEVEKKRLAEIERKKQEERKREQAEQALAQQLEMEEQERQRAAREARALAVADEYKALIRQKVSRNWVRPPGAQKGLKVTVMVKLVPGGEVLQATVVRSSGNPVFDRSVENAVYKATPLPLPQDADLFDYFREIEFLFNPED